MPYLGHAYAKMYSMLIWNSNVTKGSVFYLVSLPSGCKKNCGFFPSDTKTKVKWEIESKRRIWTPVLEKMTSLSFSILEIKDINSNSEYTNTWKDGACEFTFLASTLGSSDADGHTGPSLIHCVCA